MSRLVDSLVASLITQQVAMLHAGLRLEAGSDDEALHDLRIGVRRLRSLLTPLRRAADLPPLYEAAAALGTLSAPVRDLEVLAAELEERGYAELASVRREHLADRYAAILDSHELQRLLALLDAWPGELRDAQRDGELRRLKARIQRHLHKQAKRLASALATPGYDRHRLRLLVKRVRYAAETYPQLSDLSKRSLASLRATQSALGDWHDHFQWCARIAHEPDLEPLRAHWQQCAEAALATAEKTLKDLSKALKKDGYTSRVLSPS
ncbi:CHAD domain-containing protein [Pseudomonas sp. Gutcm_11s]|uniref:CHAD domain-containing protein n=1 Tax=Pseudomonas sp. Gutcm_11s TaxID=3026088 RepID=UPI002362E1D7|nr:CHAD domain-containing protein [Pseudomonas sp. Gutcm_11s]MDD0843947.1 CHAD domain-containing protein [Pseudomonas sp. Gutcm_11s]